MRARWRSRRDCASCSPRSPAPGARRKARPTGAPRDGAGAPVQDPFPFRALPQVEGTARDALSALERVLAVELNAAAENALIDPGEPAVLRTRTSTRARSRSRSTVPGGARAVVDALRRAGHRDARAGPDGPAAMLASDAGPGLRRR